MAKRKRRSKSTTSHRVLHWLGHILCGFVVIFLFLTLVQCTIRKPEAPSWDTKLVVPLVHKTYSMTELIENEPRATIEYVSIADASTLEELETIDRPALASLAVRIGQTRLIDSMPLGA